MGEINSIKKYNHWQILFLALCLLSGYKGSSQAADMLFMLPDNYRAQMLNPAYINSEYATLALPGFAGLSFSNEANFKITDLVYTLPTGQTIYDLGRFSEKGYAVKRNSIHLDAPLLYVGIPSKNGMFSFYLKEHISTAARFPVNTIVWFNNGNLSEEYHDFHSRDIDFNMFGYHELGVGFAKTLRNNMHFGVRGKLLLGEMFVHANNWNFGIQTSPTGGKITITMTGRGKASFPFSLVKNDLNRFQSIDSKNVISNYFSARNPGFAFDGGISIDIDEKRKFSASVTDLGLIYFSDNSWNFNQNVDYEYYGINLTNSTNSKLRDAVYIYPFYVMMDLKDSLRNVFKPFVNSKKFFQVLSPQTVLHYEYKYLPNLSVGVTNHTIFQNPYVINTLSLNALKRNGNLSLLGDLSIHQLSSVSVGGGFQWNTRFTQLFFFTDNLLAFYHPAAQKSYSVMFGLNFLLSRNNEDNNKVDGKTNYSRRGKISKYFPFYKKYK